MKKTSSYIFLSFSLLTLVGCDKGFADKNINPYALNNIDPAVLFTNAQRTTSSGYWEGEQTVVQQFVNAYNLGATAGFNFNEDNNNYNPVRWNDNYPNSIKLLVQIINLTKENPAKSNLYNMSRIWKAYIFMTMADTYGDVPYSEAGRAYLDTNYYPKYDDDKIIYDDLYIELKAASAALDANKEFVREDLLYGTTGTTAAQVTEWKRLGYSLLLRLGMRYSKLDQAKAKSVVQEAFTGGVMQANGDNAFIRYTMAYPSLLNNTIRTVNPYFYYLAEPFVNKLKVTLDPRLSYISAKYANPAQALALTPDTTRANQFGFPVGYDQNTVINMPGYRGQLGGGQNYSQLNFNTLGSATAPVFYVTLAQTKLLLSEAAFRGWLTGLPGAQTAQEYYEAGVKASMDEFSLYPTVPNPAIASGLQNSYLTNAGVAYNATNALELINTQYWIASFANGAEVFANFRRSGFPVLTPNRYNNNLQGGFVRRFAYPNEESARNSQNYQAAVAAIGGSDNLTTRVFWDTP
jgi:hypothetical protein